MANPEMGRKGLSYPDNLEGCRAKNVRISTENVVPGILSRLKEEAGNSMCATTSRMAYKSPKG